MGSISYLPSAAGNLTGLSKWPDTGSNYEKVSDYDNNTFVYTYSTIVVKDTYDFPNVSDLGVITSVVVSVTVAVYTGTGYATPILRVGTTNYGSEQAIGSEYAIKSQTWTENPATSSPWQWTDLDSAQIGVGLRTDDDSKNACCAFVQLTINYRTPSGQVRFIGMAM